MKGTLKSLTIAVTGDFGPDRSFEKIRQWIQVNGGSFAYEITPGVTHLICSKKAYKNDCAMVKTARKYGNAKIVTFDWLEDSLMRKRALSVRSYLLEKQASNTERKARKKAVRERTIQKGRKESITVAPGQLGRIIYTDAVLAVESFENGCKEFEQEMHSDGYHVYVDHTNYSYDITLTRADLLTNQNQRHVLKLYETHATPKQYACFERHSVAGQESRANPLAPVGSSFDVAFDHFKKFFLLKTGIEWDRRLEFEAASEDYFTFMRPKEGESTGVLMTD